MEANGLRRLSNNTQTSFKIAQMVAVDGRSEHEFEDESLVNPSSLTRNHCTSDVGSRDVSFSESCQRCSISCLKETVSRSIKTVLFSAKINLLMPCGPAAILVNHLTGQHGWVFFLSLLGIIPLAERLGFATEQLAFFTGPTELIISIYALKNGMMRVVQQSLLGSILSNMLLVLGCAFFSGGIVFTNKDQVFNKAAATVNSGLLLMAVMGLLFPAVLHFTRTELHFGKSELALSRFSSCIMLAAYASYLVFQLKSRKNYYEDTCEAEGQDDEDEEIQISKWEAIIWLAIVTIWISVLSEYLVDAIEGASEAWKIPIAFISVILLPIVGNAAEHASAIMFAIKDKLDISLGVAIGSSTQISMFGVNPTSLSLSIPFCVVIGWIMGRPMDLNFQLFETATLFITVLVVAFMLQDGTSNYFKGLMLILCYLIVAAGFYVHVDPTSGESRSDSSTSQIMIGKACGQHLRPAVCNTVRLYWPRSFQQFGFLGSLGEESAGHKEPFIEIHYKKCSLRKIKKVYV
ncbi:Vacuolar cation/proton exchanger 2 [Apostasia shenzhenica]|uniref:Vacuolar cation/proton exchanger n=1 Tax=Apostasia shenzhenica TaxID=1088818 RepID=A0A2I0B425_9ASPA|nr:Vacuolar cation/proton exchanger 2 [Apostasia shenzhenica]